MTSDGSEDISHPISNCDGGDSNPQTIGNEENKVIVALRLHQQNSHLLPEIPHLLTLMHSCLAYASRVLLCIDTEPSYTQALTLALQNERFITLLPVQPWGRFTQALNAAVEFASQHSYRLIIFQSLEITVHPERMHPLLSLFDREEELCLVGPELEGHAFQEGSNALRGRTCPWNTLAIWRVAFLSLIGFPLIGNGSGEMEGGVEEVSAVAVLLTIRPACKVYLARWSLHGERNEGVIWDTQGFQGDEERRRYHEKKMRSKDERPARHLHMLGLKKEITISHICL